MGEMLGYYVMPHPPIIIPEIGRGEEIKAEKTLKACRQVAKEIGDLKPETIIVITPHGPVFSDAVAAIDAPRVPGDFKRFGAPHVKMDMNVNMHLTENIIRYAEEYDIQVASITQNSLREYNILCELDHGAMVPLYFINKEYKDYEIVHITYGMLQKIDLYRLGMAIKRAVEGEEFSCVMIASGDLSHRLKDDGPYDFNPRGLEFDKEIIRLLEAGDTMGVFSLNRELVEDAGECGLRSFYILLGAMEGMDFKGELLSYEGPFGVGYGVMRLRAEKSEERAFLPELKKIRRLEYEESKVNEDPYVRLARKSLEHYVANKEYISIPEDTPKDLLNDRRGVFVSIKKNGELRGCIGTIAPTRDNIAEEIINNAVEAGIYDPRFFEVEEGELEDLVYSVDILMPAEKAAKSDLDPQRYGVIVRSDGRAGLLLPNLEGINTVDEQLEIALKKAGISPNEDYNIERFEVIRHR